MLHLDEPLDAMVCEPLEFRALEQSAPADAEMSAPREDTIDPDVLLRDAYERGRNDGSRENEANFRQALLEERTALFRVLEQVEREKKRYFAEVETEVVKLALAIAERVLHREAGMDPTLLAGAARVALDQIQDTSEAVLRVPAHDRQQWQDTLGRLGRTLKIDTDDALEKGEAVLRMRSGCVQLGLRAQLQEIEHSFFELLSRRPGVMAAA